MSKEKEMICSFLCAVAAPPANAPLNTSRQTVFISAGESTDIFVLDLEVEYVMQEQRESEV